MSKNVNAVEAREQWEVMGLPGQPVVRSQERGFENLLYGCLITSPDGKVILLEGMERQAEHAVEVLSECLKREFEVVIFLDAAKCYGGVYGFSVKQGRHLTIPDRAVVAAMAKCFTNYRPGIRADKDLQLPRMLHESAVISDGMLFDILDEERAFQLAEACECLFDLKADVVADGNGWMVIIDRDSEDNIDAGDLASLSGVCRLLQHYEIRAARVNNWKEAPELRREWRNKNAGKLDGMALAVEDINARLARIEAAIGGAAATDVMAGIPSGRA